MSIHFGEAFRVNYQAVGPLAKTVQYDGCVPLGHKVDAELQAQDEFRRHDFVGKFVTDPADSLKDFFLIDGPRDNTLTKYNLAMRDAKQEFPGANVDPRNIVDRVGELLTERGVLDTIDGELPLEYSVSPITTETYLKNRQDIAETIFPLVKRLRASFSLEES